MFSLLHHALKAHLFSYSYYLLCAFVCTAACGNVCLWKLRMILSFRHRTSHYFFWDSISQFKPRAHQAGRQAGHWGTSIFLCLPIHLHVGIISRCCHTWHFGLEVQRSSCHFLSSDGIKDVHHYSRPMTLILCVVCVCLYLFVWVCAWRTWKYVYTCISYRLMSETFLELLFTFTFWGRFNRIWRLLILLSWLAHNIEESATLYS